MDLLHPVLYADEMGYLPWKSCGDEPTGSGEIAIRSRIEAIRIEESKPLPLTQTEKIVKICILKHMDLS